MLNRNEIKKALAAYNEAMKQHEQMTKDQEIQSLQEKEYSLLAEEKYEESFIYDEQVDELIKERYPLGKWKAIFATAEELVTAMTNGLPQYGDVDVMNDIVFVPDLLENFVKLAEQV